MVAKSLEIGDLIWAKMKGYPLWPGKIMEPPADKSPKAKKPQHYVYFYGSENYAWMADENIILHNDKIVEKQLKKKRPPTYISAVEEIVEESKNSSEYQQRETSSRLSSSEDESPKNKSPHLNSVARKREMKKKMPVKKSLGNKTIQRKRTFSSDRNGEDHDDFLPSKRQDLSYTDLLSNVPPNIGYDQENRHHQTVRFDKTKYKELPPEPEFDYTSKNRNLEAREIKATNKKIGFLGLGTIGRAVVKNLIQSGHSVCIWDVNPDKSSPFLDIGAERAETPSDVVIASDITFGCFSGLDDAKRCFFESLGALKGFVECKNRGKGYVEMTSVDSTTSKLISGAIADTGGRYLEARIFGSILDAVESTLVVLCAGENSLFKECESCFKAISEKAKFLSGNVGDASNVNIIHSMLLGTVCAAVAESLALSECVGLKGEDFLDILDFGILDSRFIIDKGRCMVAEKYGTNIPLKHIQENIQYGMTLGDTLHQPLHITGAANEVYKHCKCLRYGEHDVSVVYEGTRR